jgi:hypothetical protein
MRIHSWALPLLATLAFLPGLACSDNATSGAIVFADAHGDGINGKFDTGHSDGNGADAADDATATESDGGSTDDTNESPGYVYYDLGAAQGKPPKGDDGIPCLDQCQVAVTQNSSRAIGALVLAADKKTPISNIMVQFVIKDPTVTDASILSGTVPTDQDGRATTSIKAGMQVGWFTVVVSVVDHPEVAPIEYVVSAQSKVKGPPTLTLHYIGATSLADFSTRNIRLIKQVAGQPTCKNLDLFDVNNLPPAVSTSPNIQFDKAWTVSKAYVDTLPPDGTPVPYTVVALGWKQGVSSMGGNPSVGGCIDTGFTVHLNKSTQGIEGDNAMVKVYDLPLRLKGIYDMTTFIDLLSLLPPTVEKFVKIVLNIVSDPVAGLLSTICTLAGQPNQSLADICAAIFTDPNNPDPDNLGGVGGIVVTFLKNIIYALLPPQVLQVITTTKDLKTILENFTVNGTIEIIAEPDDTGFLSATYTKQTWSSITYKWSLGQSCPATDPNCGKKTINFDQFQPDVVTGSFDLWRNFLPKSLVPDGTIKFGKHALNVKWGALINFILEKQLLPLITYDPKDPTAPTIDSYEKLIKWLLGGSKKCLIKDTCCADFVNGITGTGAGLAGSLLSGACNAATTLGSSFLEGYLNSLDAVTGNPATGQGLILGTDKCPILDPNGDNIVDDLGSPDTTSTVNQCQWDMTLGIGGGTPKAITARFFAIRQP